MTPEQQAAFVYSQATAAAIEALGMHAENTRRAFQHQSPAHSRLAFIALLDKYGLDRHAVLTSLGIGE